MEPLPFEGDSRSFLIACSRILTEKAQTPEQQTWEPAASPSAVFFSESAPYSLQEDTRTVVEHTPAIDPEVISRAFQRDARRYD